MPFSSWPEDSYSLPRNTMKSFSSLGRQSAISTRALSVKTCGTQAVAYRISNRVKACFPVTEVKGLKDGIAGL